MDLSAFRYELTLIFETIVEFVKKILAVELPEFDFSGIFGSDDDNAAA